jgi:glycosyltransferase involved in cell wall biosynthesis
LKIIYSNKNPNIKSLLFINHSSSLTGGANDDYIRLIKYFYQQRDKYRIYGLFPEGPNAVNYAKYCDEWKTYPIGFFSICPTYWKDYLYPIKHYFLQKNQVKNFLNERKYDLCIINVIVLVWPALWIYREKIKSIIFIRETVTPFYWRYFLYKIMNIFGKYFVAVSDSLVTNFQKVTKNNNISLVYSAIEDKLEYELKQQDFLDQISKEKFWNNSRKIFVCIGSLCDNKNQLLILKAAVMLKFKKNITMPYFLFIGEELDSSYTSILKKFTLCNYLDKHCFFLGEKDKNYIYNLLQFVNGMIISSKTEGLPLVLVEALRFKTPVITTSVGGIGDVITNKYNGIVIEENENDLVKAIEMIMDDQELVSSLILNGFRTYKEKFNLEANLEKINFVVNEIIREE